MWREKLIILHKVLSDEANPNQTFNSSHYWKYDYKRRREIVVVKECIKDR